MSGSQRWRERSATYRPADDERFDPRHHAVVAVETDSAVRRFVERHHYSATLPNSTGHRFLLVDARQPSWAEGGGVVGVATFGSPSGPKVLSKAFPFLAAPSSESVELQRLVMLDRVLKNGESWFVSQCFAQLKASTPVEAVVSFSDPAPRLTAAGALVMPGHVGCVYQALSAWATGRSKARWTWMRHDGRLVNERDVTKIQAACPCCGSGRSTSGADGAVERFVEWGAPAPSGCWRTWVASALPCVASRVRHGGNHRYVWGLSRAAHKGLKKIHGPVDKDHYPKTKDEPLVGRRTA